MSFFIDSIVSEPPGVVVETSTGDRCTTPCELEVGLNEKVSLSFQKEGFRTKNIKVRPVPEEFSPRAVIASSLYGAVSGALTASMAEAIGQGFAAIFAYGLFGIDPDEHEYEPDKSFIAKGGMVGALAGLGIGYGVHKIFQEKRLRSREQVSVKLKPISN